MARGKKRKNIQDAGPFRAGGGIQEEIYLNLGGRYSSLL